LRYLREHIKTLAVTWLDGNGDPQQTHTYRSLTEARVLGRHWKQDFNTR
jgi:hypothetical protein